MTDRTRPRSPPSPASGRRAGHFQRRLNALVAVVALPLVILQVAQFVRDEREAEREVRTRLAARAEGVAGNLVTVLSRAEGLLDFLAQRELMLALTPEACGAMLRGVTQVDAMYTNVLLVDGHGTLVCGSAFQQLQDYATTPWFVEGLRAPGYRLAEPVVGRLTGKRVSLLTRPLRGADGQLALLGVAIDLKALAGALTADGGLPDEVISVVKDGEIYLLRSSEPDRFIGRPVSDTLRTRLRRPSPDGPDTARGPDGVERDYAVADLSTYGLHVLVGQPTAVLHGAILRSLGWRIAGPLLVLALGLLAAALAARNLARPLHRIAETTRAIAAGATDVRVDPGLPGEFGEVATEFNRLMDAQREQAALREQAAAVQARATFFAQVSHELRTPLNAILGFAELLEAEARADLSPRARVQLDNVRLAATQLRAIIDDVLDLSRIDAGLMTLEPAAVPLPELLDGTLALCAAAAQRQQVGVRWAPHGALPAVAWLDPVRTRQVLLNLLTNAIKYNRPGGSATLTLEAAGGALRFTVADTGLGMSPAQLASLFEPFNRLGRDALPVEGTGIGLNLTRQLVGLMGGQLAVRSTEHVGTTVVVTLPFAAPPVAAAASPPASTASPVAPAPRGRVLYVEDNPVNVLLVEQLLARWPDVRLEVAETGAAALRAIDAAPPDVVLLDMNLPDMDGLQVLAQVRTTDRGRALPVVVLSASAGNEEVRAALAAGARAYWPKPIDFAQVLRGLEALLADRGSPHQSETT